MTQIQEISIELRAEALSLMSHMPRPAILLALFTPRRFSTATTQREFLATTLLSLTKSETTVFYQHSIIKLLANIW
mgnify:CR=1 FL=1